MRRRRRMLASQASSLQTKTLETAKMPRDMLHISGFLSIWRIIALFHLFRSLCCIDFFFPGMKNKKTTKFLIKLFIFFVSVRFQPTGLRKNPPCKKLIRLVRLTSKYSAHPSSCSNCLLRVRLCLSPASKHLSRAVMKSAAAAEQ